MVSVMIHQSFLIGNVSHTYYTGRSQNRCETARWLVKHYLKTKPLNTQPWLTGVTLIEMRDSRIDMLIPVMANNVPRKRTFMIASSAAMTRPRVARWNRPCRRPIIDDTAKVVWYREAVSGYWNALSFDICYRNH